MLTFAEEILVLLLDDEDGVLLPVGKTALDCALAGSVLMDLAFANRIDTDPERLVVVSPEPTGNASLDRVLKHIVDREEVQDTKAWIEDLSSEAGTIQEHALASLVTHGVLERQEEKFLWVFRSRRYPVIDGKVEQEAKKRIADVLFSDEIPDPRDVALICLADTCNILQTVFDKKEIKRVAPRIEQLRRMDLIGSEVTGAIADIERSIMLAMAYPMR